MRSFFKWCRIDLIKEDKEDGEFDEGGADEGLIEDVAGLAVDGEGLWFLDALRGRDEGGGEA